MLLDLDYNTIFQVIDSWETLRRVPDYEKIAGTLLFEHLFEECPQTKLVFGFPIGMDPKSDQLKRSKRFIMHSSYLIQMLDKAMDMLGPDIELLADVLANLGKKHLKFGVKEEYFPHMGNALLETLQEMLKGDFTDENYKAWTTVYLALSTEMRNNMKVEKIVLDSWNKLKTLEDYETVAGTMLFQTLFEKCPATKAFFGFPHEMDPKSEMMTKSRRFGMHSSYFIQMLDETLNMKEMAELEDNMTKLGKLHSAYGVKQEYFPIMGEALIHTLKQILMEDFDSEVEKAWVEFYGKISKHMLVAMDATLSKA